MLIVQALSVIAYLFYGALLVQQPPPQLRKNASLLTAADNAREEMQRKVARAFEGTRDVFSWWTQLWIGWALLYSSLALPNLIASPALGKDPKYAILTVFLNNVCSALVIAIFVEMTFKTAKTDSTSIPGADNGRSLYALYYAVPVFLAVVQLVAVTKVGASANAAFEVASGVIGGVAHFLLIARFFGRSLDVPWLALLILTAYAAVQAAFSQVNGISAMGAGDGIVMRWVPAVLVSFALFCKAVLFSVMHWMRDTGRLTYYMLRTAATSENEPAMRHAFLLQLESDYPVSQERPDPAVPAVR